MIERFIRWLYGKHIALRKKNIKLLEKLVVECNKLMSELED